MTEAIPDSWRAALAPALASDEARRLGEWLRAEEAGGKAVHPPRGSRLRALELTPLEEVRAVILGQDPYHGPGQAHGLAFSVPDGVKVPPSLRNIYKELHEDLGIAPPPHGNLEHWAREGVLLLNTSLTVEEAKAGSHAGRGWETITDAAITAVAQRAAPTVFLLWGAHAQKKLRDIPALSAPHHLVIQSPHPSPLSARRGFFGSRPFSRANAFLKAQGRGIIDWSAL
ncbi:uracil-DNA glycosylase [Erythrobacteraceae bacterium WH01K]|nr:uracil-DNA glycosylase [Erythrobacteraceae bacterium WH01K]